MCKVSLGGNRKSVADMAVENLNKDCIISVLEKKKLRSSFRCR